MDQVNTEYKDRLFVRVFGGRNKMHTLQLYNALRGTNYTNPDDLTITTAENVVYLKMRNDISFLVGDFMNLLEHQSTFNPNMPMRGLL